MSAELHHAIFQKDLPACANLISSGVDVNAPTKRGRTPLACAIERTFPQIAQLLLDNGADAQKRDRRGRTPLHWAAQYGPLDIVQALLNYGANPYAFDIQGISPLQHAVRNGHNAIVKLMLETSPLTEQTLLDDGARAFKIAVKHRRTDLARLLLDQGVDINIQMANYYPDPEDFRYTTHLMTAATQGDLPMVSLLLEYGADPHFKSDRYSALTEALAGHHHDVAHVLIAQGVTLGLEEAVVINDIPMAAQFLEEDADVEMPIKRGRTLLEWVCIRGKTEMARLLVTHGADVNAQGPSFGMPLVNAAKSGQLDLVQFLLEHNADSSKGAKENKIPLIAFASGEGHQELVAWLLTRFGLDPDRGKWALGLAVSFGHTEIARMLLEAGANVGNNRLGLTNLWSAAFCGRIDMMRLLLKYGATIDSRTHNGITPIMDSARNGYAKAVQLLIDHGADINAEDERGASVLFFGLECKNGRRPEVITVLIANGADIHHRDKQGQTALAFAQQQPHRKGNQDIVEILRHAGAPE